MSNRRSTRSNILPIFLSREFAQALPDEDHRQEGEGASQGDEGDSDKAVLQAHAINPRVDAIRDGEAERVADDDDGDR
jgi:hypothetical protein